MSLPSAVTPAGRAADVSALAAALVEHRGCVLQVARLLSLSSRTIHRRIDAYGLRAWLRSTYPDRGQRDRRAREASGDSGRSENSTAPQK